MSAPSGIIWRGDGTHRCQPPINRGQMIGDRTHLPLETIWRCECGKRYVVGLDDWGKTWRRVHVPFWTDRYGWAWWPR